MLAVSGPHRPPNPHPQRGLQPASQRPAPGGHAPQPLTATCRDSTCGAWERLQVAAWVLQRPRRWLRRTVSRPDPCAQPSLPTVMNTPMVPLAHDGASPSENRATGLTAPRRVSARRRPITCAAISYARSALLAAGKRARPRAVPSWQGQTGRGVCPTSVDVADLPRRVQPAEWRSVPRPVRNSRRAPRPPKRNAAARPHAAPPSPRG